ncbi:Chaperonin 10 [Heracleum sosnowskyi]|uniref:Chaperonin 10 n=1 Tax=Heracleum sosnowskyi TaxID=360622 RepID=A0AAD8NBA2_9APIA|nr:Chaperonin 10 [Heracleum sosnowskyi]
MEEYEFRQILDLFPVVRSRNYRADSGSSKQATSRSVQNEQLDEWQDAWDSDSNKNIDIKGSEEHDEFWKKLRLAAAKKLGAAEADRFCKEFQHVHKKLVYEELSLDAAQRFLNSSKAW